MAELETVGAKEEDKRSENTDNVPGKPRTIWIGGDGQTDG